MKLNEPLDVDELVNGVDLSQLATQLKAMDKVGEYFDQQPAEKRLHIVVELPDGEVAVFP